MTWNLLLGILVLASAVASLPLDHGRDLSKTAGNYNKENVLSNSSGNYEDNTYVGKNKEDEVSSSSDEEIGDEGTAGGEEQQPKFCKEPTNFTIVYTKYEIVNGEHRIYNASKVVHTFKCCEGYAKGKGKKCRLDLCKGKVCQEDPQSKCVTLEWCGDLVPVFVTNTSIISDVCTQPNKAQERLDMCHNDTSTCQDSPHCNDGEAVCISNKCDCTLGPVWLQPNGKEALC